VLAGVVVMTARFTLLAVTLTLAVAVRVSVLAGWQTCCIWSGGPTETTVWQPEPGIVAVVVEVMVAVPTATPVTKPPGEVTVAIVGSELDQLTEPPPISFWLPSVYMPCTTSWTVSLIAIVGPSRIDKRRAERITTEEEATASCQECGQEQAYGYGQHQPPADSLQSLSTRSGGEFTAVANETTSCSRRTHFYSRRGNLPAKRIVALEAEFPVYLSQSLPHFSDCTPGVHPLLLHSGQDPGRFCDAGKCVLSATAKQPL